jgi:hypothetical protein
MTPEEKELHEFFNSILSEKAKEKFDRLMEIQKEKYAPERAVIGKYIQLIGRSLRWKP